MEPKRSPSHRSSSSSVSCRSCRARASTLPLSRHPGAGGGLQVTSRADADHRGTTRETARTRGAHTVPTPVGRPCHACSWSTRSNAPAATAACASSWPPSPAGTLSNVSSSTWAKTRSSPRRDRPRTTTRAGGARGGPPGPNPRLRRFVLTRALGVTLTSVASSTVTEVLVFARQGPGEVTGGQLTERQLSAQSPPEPPIPSNTEGGGGGRGTIRWRRSHS